MPSYSCQQCGRPGGESAICGICIEAETSAAGVQIAVGTCGICGAEIPRGIKYGIASTRCERHVGRVGLFSPGRESSARRDPPPWGEK